MSRSGIPAALGLLITVVPDPGLVPLGALLIAFVIALPPPGPRERLVDARLAPLALFVLFAALRCAWMGGLWWPHLLGWMLALSVASAPAPARLPLAPFALAAAFLHVCHLLPSALPALLLVGLATLQVPSLDRNERSCLLVSGLALAGAFGLEASGLAAAGPGVGLSTIDRWWRAQVLGLEALRSSPLLGTGPGTATAGGPAIRFLVENGWLGYGLLAISAYRIGLDRLGWPGLLVLAGVAAADSAPDGTLLRLAPLAGIVLARALPPASARAASGRWRQHPLAEATRAAVAASLLLGGMAQGAADCLVAVADSAQRRLDWPAATRLYRFAGRLGPDPSAALERLSDLELRSARFRGTSNMDAAAKPLLELVGLGLATGWTWYRLSEVEAFAGDPRGRALACALQAAELWPRSALVRVVIGHQHLARREIERAVAAFRQAVELDPSLLPRLFRDVRRVTVNSALLRQILPPGHLETHLELAALFESTGLIPAALSEFEALLAGGGAPFRVHIEYADLLARSGRSAMAVATLRELARWGTLGPRDRRDIAQRLERLAPETP